MDKYVVKSDFYTVPSHDWTLDSDQELNVRYSIPPFHITFLHIFSLCISLFSDIYFNKAISCKFISLTANKKGMKKSLLVPLYIILFSVLFDGTYFKETS